MIQVIRKDEGKFEFIAQKSERHERLQRTCSQAMLIALLTRAGFHESETLFLLSDLGSEDGRLSYAQLGEGEYLIVDSANGKAVFGDCDVFMGYLMRDLGLDSLSALWILHDAEGHAPTGDELVEMGITSEQWNELGLETVEVDRGSDRKAS